jgi:hypothetical protein
MEAPTRNGKTTDKEQEAQVTFGFLIDRISLIIQAAASNSTDQGQEKHEPASLVDTCKLCMPYGPTLPLPILELFLWIHSDNVLEKDRCGMLAIHYALQNRFRRRNNSSSNSSGVEDWQAFVSRLIDEAPYQCRIKTPSGRLPVHILLDETVSQDACEQSSSCDEVRVKAWHAIVEKLVTMFPESVDQRDPHSGLYPFMMASVGPTSSLDTIYLLLRRSPSRCLQTNPGENR